MQRALWGFERRQRIGGIRENTGIGGKIAGAGTARTAPHRFGLADHGNLLVQLERRYLVQRVTAILREGDGVQLPLAHSGGTPISADAAPILDTFLFRRR